MVRKACYEKLYEKVSETLIRENVVMDFDCLRDFGFRFQRSNNTLQIRNISTSYPVSAFCGIQA